MRGEAEIMTSICEVSADSMGEIAATLLMRRRLLGGNSLHIVGCREQEEGSEDVPDPVYGPGDGGDEKGHDYEVK